MPCVYILKGDRFYIGSTTDLERRLQQHRSGHTLTTKRIGDWKLVRSIQTETLIEARTLERKIKKSGHPERWC